MISKFKNLISCLIICTIIIMCSCEGKNSTEIIQNKAPSEDVMIYRNWQETIQDEETKRLADLRRESYDKVIEGFKQESISDDVKSSNASEEYRVVYNISRNRYEYYSLIVFPDGMGKFHLMINKSEVFKENSIVLDETKDLSDKEVNTLLLALQENDFGNIPTICSKKNIGPDGRTIFIEGYKNEKTHFIVKWMPSEEDSIEKIYRVFVKFADEFTQKSSLSEYPFMQVQD